MAAIGSRTSGYTGQFVQWLLNTWSASDRGWRATTLGGLVVVAVFVGLTIPW